MSQKKIIVGDVHGCYDELCELLCKAEFDEASDRLIFVGDLMDRGPGSREVFAYVRKLKSEIGDRLVIVRGNHEQMFIDRDEFWKDNGGTKTISSFRACGDDANKHRAWFVMHTVPYYVDPEEPFQVVHAGLYHEDPAEEEEDTLLWDREPLEKGMYAGKFTFCGHTPTQFPLLSFRGADEAPHFIRIEYGTDYDMQPSLGLINLDTGCVFGGALTAAIVQNGKIRFIKADSRRKSKGQI